MEEKVDERTAANMRERYLRLFQRRKIADHKPYLFSLEEAEETVMEAKRLMNELVKAFEG